MTKHWILRNPTDTNPWDLPYFGKSRSTMKTARYRMINDGWFWRKSTPKQNTLYEWYVLGKPMVWEFPLLRRPHIAAYTIMTLFAGKWIPFLLRKVEVVKVHRISTYRDQTWSGPSRLCTCPQTRRWPWECCGQVQQLATGYHCEGSAPLGPSGGQVWQVILWCFNVF